MTLSRQRFGGDWTAEKLKHVKKYLHAYATIMKRQKYRFAYIDAFAGTGYREQKLSTDSNEQLFPELNGVDAQKFLKGSARIALEVTPRFNKYIFIEKDWNRFEELKRLKTEHPSVADEIELINRDANSYLQDLCLDYKWDAHRAVLFLDPFGMQVDWDTIAAIAETKAIDLWILFPIGVAVNRLLKKHGQISSGWRQSLDKLFGASDWYDVFYKVRKEQDLLGERSVIEKTASFDSIGCYYVERLKTIFAGVADNPLSLFNSRNNPLYLLCFASANPVGAKTAVKIAQDILKR